MFSSTSIRNHKYSRPTFAFLAGYCLHIYSRAKLGSTSSYPGITENYFPWRTTSGSDYFQRSKPPPEFHMLESVFSIIMKFLQRLTSLKVNLQSGVPEGETTKTCVQRLSFHASQELSYVICRHRRSRIPYSRVRHIKSFDRRRAF